MPYARYLIGSLLAAGSFVLVGCSGLPKVGTPARAPAVTTQGAAPPRAEEPVAPEIRREYDQALALVKAGRNDQAAQALQRMVAAYPDLAGPLANLGIVYARLGKLKEAEDALQRAAKINGRSAAIYNELGIFYRSNGRFEDAERAYERALQVEPNYVYAHLNLGILYDIYLAKPAKALQHYQRYQELLPTEDKQVSKWIIDLKQRSPSASKPERRDNG